MATFPDETARNPLAADCRRCPDLVVCRERIAWGNGPLDAAVIVEGEAPGTGNPDAERWRGGNWTSRLPSYRTDRSLRQIECRTLLARIRN